MTEDTAERMVELSTSEISERVGGEVAGDGARTLRGVAPLDEAGPDELSFLASQRYLPRLQTTRAGAVLVPRSLRAEAPPEVALIRVDDPYVALARILPLLYPAAPEPPGVHATASVAADAVLGAEVRVGPYAVVGAGARLGDRVHVGAHALVGAGCRVGADTVLHPQVTLHDGVRVGERCVIHSGARLGAEGFRFVFVDGSHRKMPHIGGCVIGDDVEIGANTTVDRGSIGDTTIGDGTKIDNLVQIGHNVQIGRHVLIVAQVGISGSTVVGDYVVLGGQAATNPHVTIGTGAKVAGRGAVTADVAPGETVSGYPARPHREAMRAQAALFRLPQLMKRIQEIEQAVFGRPGSGAPRRAGGAE